MCHEDKEKELYRGDELPIPLAFPLLDDLTRDNLVRNLTSADLQDALPRDTDPKA